ncbi:hypothetical protein [Actinopolyspora xinjiangensis]|uniref:hypothetical protein n=1 Tax=Actinopolyspora xinjiangensis TaxID=405564 RepID=UPI0011135A6F|nr:hypothetical protein [Actinopolyspora xinjiangensis]
MRWFDLRGGLRDFLSLSSSSRSFATDRVTNLRTAETPAKVVPIATAAIPTHSRDNTTTIRAVATAKGSCSASMVHRVRSAHFSVLTRLTGIGAAIART